MSHALIIGNVLSYVSKMQTKGRGKRRAWCEYCNSLKDKRRFHWCVFSPHPDSETGLYYEPYGDWVCHDCIKKRTDWRMSKREHMKRLRATIKRSCEPLATKEGETE